MQTSIVITFEVEGLHNWPTAGQYFPEVSFLEHPHRHIFKFKIVKPVEHDDRDVEIIRFKREVLHYLSKTYTHANGLQHHFGPRSCEMLAKELLIKFKAGSVECLEDGENGALVVA